MKSFKTLSICLPFLIVGNFVHADVKNITNANSGAKCRDLIKECFAYGNDERAECFYVSGQHSLCENTDLGELSMQRWYASPSKNPDLDAGPALLGPRLVDQACVANFDNQFSMNLLKGSINAKMLKNLSGMLSKCTRDVSNELTRP